MSAPLDAVAERDGNLVRFLVDDDCHNAFLEVSVRWDGVVDLRRPEGRVSTRLSYSQGIRNMAAMLEILYDHAKSLMPEHGAWM